MLKMQHNTRHLLLNVAISECTSDARPTLGYSLGSVAIPASFCFSRPLQGNQVMYTTSELQATIKGWWWLITTLWCNSG